MTRTQVIDQAIGEIAKNNNKEEYEVTALEVTNFLAEQIVEQNERLFAYTEWLKKEGLLNATVSRVIVKKYQSQQLP